MAEIWVIIRDQKPIPDPQPCGCRSAKAPIVVTARGPAMAKIKRLRCRDCGKSWTRHEISGD